MASQEEPAGKVWAEVAWPGEWLVAGMVVAARAAVEAGKEVAAVEMAAADVDTVVAAVVAVAADSGKGVADRVVAVVVAVLGTGVAAGLVAGF